jgi:DNA-binding IclR family transcriptional regulator
LRKKRGRKRIEGADRRTSFLTSVERTLDVIEIISKGRLIGITQLANIMKIGTSSAHRILATLEKKGFAVQEPDTGKYTVGHMLVQLTKSVIRKVTALKYIQPALDELCGKTGENVIFGVVTPSKDKILVLAEEIADKTIIIKPMLYKYLPLYVCSCGKEYLLTLNDKQIKALLSKTALAPFTKYTLTSFTAFRKQLARFRKLGHSITKDELAVGESEIASAIIDAEDRFAGAIAIVVPTFRFTDKNIKRWGKILTRATRKLSLEFKAKGIT